MHSIIFHIYKAASPAWPVKLALQFLTPARVLESRKNFRACPGVAEKIPASGARRSRDRSGSPCSSGSGACPRVAEKIPRRVRVGVGTVQVRLWPAWKFLRPVRVGPRAGAGLNPAGPGMVWNWFRLGSGLAWSRYGLVWFRLGCGLAWIRFELTSFGNGFALVWDGWPWIGLGIGLG